MSQLRAHLAPPARTLVDVFRATVETFGDAHALDNGVEVLTYAEFADAAEEVATELAAHGIGRGDRVGVRIASGTTTLYTAIMGILLAGAAYVPVDADDPDERARTVFDEAGVAAILGNGLAITTRGARRAARAPLPSRPDSAPAATTPVPADPATEPTSGASDPPSSQSPFRPSDDAPSTEGDSNHE